MIACERNDPIIRGKRERERERESRATRRESSGAKNSSRQSRGNDDDSSSRIIQIAFGKCVRVRNAKCTKQRRVCNFIIGD